MKEVVLGIDIGTTSTKGIIYSSDLRPLLTENVSYPLYQDEDGMAEQDPDEIFETVLQIIKKLSQVAKVENYEIKSIGFSSAMHSLIVLDEMKKPITRSITWLDNRSMMWSDWLKNSGKGLEFYLRTGTPTHAMSPLSKLLWLKEVEPSLLSQGHYFLGIKEYIMLQLFDEFVCDYSLAGGTGLFNINEMAWDEEILALLGISTSQLPQVVAPKTAYRQLVQGIKEELALPTKTPFIIGASDGCLANLGSGAKENTQAVVTVGTSSAIRLTTDRPILDPLGRTFCYPLSDFQWVVGGASNNGGNIFQWALELTKQEGDYQGALKKAEAAGNGAAGLIFLPYLNGERAPLWSEKATGSLIGLRSIHQEQDILRAALEGIFFNLAELLAVIKEQLHQPQELILNGGLFQGELPKKLGRTILNLPTRIPENIESSCLGAAILGAEAVNFEVSLHHHKSQHLIPVNQRQQVEYQEIYQKYQGLNKLLNNY
ncbi:gluconokinase [Vagococcus salmoninarum]|uniref:Gluconate kinase n=1 Tax=Vagococcus salmoninarum TaxID=2739 RepID=A0A429ZW36_9ENTE|nr:gluconokinase [Vagococcus salmoninarum]RST97987.1 hypothetical protein CBF35_01470 [Vagococcus salmoninarum]